MAGPRDFSPQSPQAPFAFPAFDPAMAFHAATVARVNVDLWSKILQLQQAADEHRLMRDGVDAAVVKFKRLLQQIDESEQQLHALKRQLEVAELSLKEDATAERLLADKIESSRAELEALQANLATAKEEKAQAEEEKAQAEEDKQKILDEVAAQLQVLQDTQRTVEQAKITLNRVQQNSAATAKRASAAIKTATQQLAALKKEVSVVEQQLKALTAKQVKKSAEMMQLGRRTGEAKHALATVTAELEMKCDENRRLDVAKAKIQVELQAKRDEGVRLDAVIAATRVELETKCGDIVQLDAAIAERNVELQKRRDQVARLDAAIEKMKIEELELISGEKREKRKAAKEARRDTIIDPVAEEDASRLRGEALAVAETEYANLSRLRGQALRDAYQDRLQENHGLAKELMMRAIQDLPQNTPRAGWQRTVQLVGGVFGRYDQYEHIKFLAGVGVRADADILAVLPAEHAAEVNRILAIDMRRGMRPPRSAERVGAPPALAPRGSSRGGRR